MSHREREQDLPGDEDEPLPPDGYGRRRVRRRTNFAWRQDALRPGHVRDANELFHAAGDFVRSATEHLIVGFSAMAMLAGGNAAGYAAWAIEQITEAREYCFMFATFFAFRAVCLFHDFMDIVYYPLANREAPSDHFRPKQNRRLEELDDATANNLTGLNVHQLQELYTHWRLEPEMRTEGRRTVFTGEELLIIYLYFLKHGHTFLHMAAWVFGGDPREYTYAMRCIVNHLYKTFYHKISGDSMRQWLPYITIFRHAICARLQSNARDDELRFDPNLAADQYAFPNEDPHLFRHFGFLDDYGVRSSRVGDER